MALPVYARSFAEADAAVERGGQQCRHHEDIVDL
jgi:hypothetical protein